MGVGLWECFILQVGEIWELKVQERLIFKVLEKWYTRARLR